MAPSFFRCDCSSCQAREREKNMSKKSDFRPRNEHQHRWVRSGVSVIESKWRCKVCGYARPMYVTGSAPEPEREPDNYTLQAQENQRLRNPLADYIDQDNRRQLLEDPAPAPPEPHPRQARIRFLEFDR